MPNFLFPFSPRSGTDTKTNEQIKEYLANPEAFAAAAATPAAAADSGAGGGAAPAAAAAEPEEESDDDMVSADLTTPTSPHPHIPIARRRFLFFEPRARGSRFAHRTPTDKLFSIPLNFPPSISMGTSCAFVLDPFHRVSISSAKQTAVPYLTWSQVSTIVVAVLLLCILFALSPEGPERNIRIFAISARLHGVTLPGDHK